MSKRFGRRQKAKLKAELDNVKDQLKWSRNLATTSQTKIDNAPYTYKLASEICQIAKNINQHFDIIKPDTRERIRQISAMQRVFKAEWHPEDERQISPIPYEHINCNPAQVFYDVQEIFNESNILEKMTVFTFKYGNERTCYQLTDEALRNTTHKEIVSSLVEHMVDGINRYQGD